MKKQLNNEWVGCRLLGSHNHLYDVNTCTKIVPGFTSEVVVMMGKAPT